MDFAAILLLCPWDSPGKNTGVGCHFLLQCMKVKLLGRVRPSAIPWTAAFQAPLSMGFSRQEYWSGVLLPSLSKVETLPVPSFPLLFPLPLSLPPLSSPAAPLTAMFLHRSAQPRGCDSLAAWPLGHCLWPKAMRVRMTVHTLRSCTHPAPLREEPSVARCSLIQRLEP